MRPETRAFRRLRHAYARAADPELEGAGPVELIDTLRRRGYPHAEEAERLIRAYLSLRFAPSGAVSGASSLRADVRRLTAALRGRRVRRLLRRAGG